MVRVLQRIAFEHHPMRRSILESGFAGLSLVMVIGGAVNDGMTFFLNAIPFALYLFVFALRRGKIYAWFVSAFFVACLIASIYKFDIPFLYPILGRNVETDTSGYVVGDGSHSFWASKKEVSIFLKPVAGQPIDKILCAVPAHSRLKVVRIFEKNWDFGFGPGAIARYPGCSEEFQIDGNDAEPLNSHIKTALPFANPATHFLGEFMIYPIIPFIIFSAVLSNPTLLAYLALPVILLLLFRRRR